MAKLMITLFSILGLAGLFGCGKEQDQGSQLQRPPAAKTPDSPAAPADPKVKAYPLKTCVVSGEVLGKMGEPMRFNYKGQEIKLCCKGCDKDFQKEPEKYLQKIAAAAGK